MKPAYVSQYVPIVVFSMLLASCWSPSVEEVDGSSTLVNTYSSQDGRVDSHAVNQTDIDRECEGDKIFVLARRGYDIDDVAAVHQFASTRMMAHRPLRLLTRQAARKARAYQHNLEHDLFRIHILEIDQSRFHEALSSLRQDKRIVFAEGVCPVWASHQPNDPYYLNGDLWGLQKLNAEPAWDVTWGEGVVVGVVDTGVDRSHPDLVNNIWRNDGEIPDNGIDDDGNGFVDDVYGYNFFGSNNWTLDQVGHGTHVAGTIAGTGNNAQGVVGMAFKAEIMPIKVFGSSNQADSTYSLLGFQYAADNGAHIINASLGGPRSQAACAAVDYAISQGTVLVGAAGNASQDASAVAPASCPGAIAVSAIDRRDNLCDFSNFGSMIMFAAPGCESNIHILSTIPGGRYASFAGTSMAAPHVAGVAALVRAAAPDLSVQQVQQIMIDTAVDIGAPGRDSWFGYGYPDVAAAVVRARSMSQQQPPTIHLEPVYQGFVGQLLKIVPQAFDANDDRLTFTAPDLPEHASFDGDTGVVEFLPKRAGVYSLVIAVTDGYFPAVSAQTVIDIAVIASQGDDASDAGQLHTRVGSQLVGGCRTNQPSLGLLILLILWGWGRLARRYRDS